MDWKQKLDSWKGGGEADRSFLTWHKQCHVLVPNSICE